jgi:putative restriction endonuclease
MENVVMAFYWVNVGRTFKEVSENKFLWAPSHSISKNGSIVVNAGWKQVPEIKKGDIIFCNRDGYIVYVAVAETDASPSPIPPGRKFEAWKKDGYKINVRLEELTTKIDTCNFKEEFSRLFNERCTPTLLNVNMSFNEIYMAAMPDVAGAYLLNLLGDITINVYDATQNTLSDKKKKVTTRERDVIVSARIGQGKFRSDVLNLWDNKCPVTEVDMPELLIASHIVPWVLADNDGKVDVYNGLPLSPAIDKLFDRGYVSFSDEGFLLKSDKLQSETLARLGIDQDKKINGLTEEHKYYLQKHRVDFGFDKM